MNPKTTAILIIVLALAGMAYFLTRTSTGPNLNPEAGSDTRDSYVMQEHLDGFDVEQIKIDYEGGTGGGLHLKRQQNRWLVTHPHRFPANASTVREFLALLNNLRGYAGEVQDIADAPEILLLSADDHIRIALMERIGARRAKLVLDTGTGPRAQSAQDTLHQYIDNFAIEDFFSKKIAVPLLPEIARIEFMTPEGQSLLVQRDERWWIGESESAERALTEDVGLSPGIAQLLGLMSKIELLELQDRYSSLAAFGLKDPIASVKLYDVDPQNEEQPLMEIKVGVPADPEDRTRFVSINYTGELRPAVFKVATEYAMLLGQSAKAFRDPRILATPSSLIASISLIKPDETRNSIELFTNTPPALRQAEGEARPLSLQKTAKLLDQLSNARASDYVRIRLDEWNKLFTALITARLDTGSETFTVYTDPQSDADEPTVLVHRGNEPVALRVPREAVEGLLDPSTLLAEDKE